MSTPNSVISSPPPPPQYYYPPQKGNTGKLLLYGGAAVGLGLVGYGVYSYLNSQNQTNQLAASTCGQAYQTAYTQWLTLYAQSVKQYPGGIPTSIMAELNTLQGDMTQALNCMTTLAAQSDTTGSIGYAIANIMNSAFAKLVATGIVAIGLIYVIARVIATYGGSIRTAAQSLSAGGTALSQAAADDGVITEEEATGMQAALADALDASLTAEAEAMQLQVEALIGEGILEETMGEAIIGEIAAAETVEELAVIEAIVLAVPK